MSIPTAALKVQLRMYTQTFKSCQSQIRRIENMTGMRQFNHAFEYDQAEARDWKTLDLIDIARNLSGLLSRHAFLRSQVETEIHLIGEMRQSTEDCENESEKRNANASKIDSSCCVRTQLRDTQSWYLGIQARCGYLTKRIKAQVQIVQAKPNLFRVQY